MQYELVVASWLGGSEAARQRTLPMSASDGTSPSASEHESGDIEAGWRVHRRFSQFAQLHHELRTQHPSALLACGAQLPSKFRLPSSMYAEGAQRLQLLQAYLVALLGNEALRRSDPLLYFVGANYSTARRRVWKAAVVSGSGQNFRLRQPTRAQSRQKHKVQTTI